MIYLQDDDFRDVIQRCNEAAILAIRETIANKVNRNRDIALPEVKTALSEAVLHSLMGVNVWPEHTRDAETS